MTIILIGYQKLVSGLGSVMNMGDQMLTRPGPGQDKRIS
jgi:hypothetical protein